MFRTLVVLAACFGSAAATRRRRVEGEDNQDISWLANYNVVYEACFHSEQSVVYRLCPRYDNYGNSNNNGNNDNGANNKNRRNSCAVDCDNGAEYLAHLADFVDAFTEAQMEARAYRCEYARENCEYEDDNLCFDSNELQYCQEDWGDAMEVQEWLECQEIEGDAEEGVQYYVGPYCGEDNYGIHLGVFTDEDCTERADDNSAFYNANGYDLPYSEESGDSLVGTQVGNNVETNTQCASCKEHALEQDKNEGDQEDEDDVLEQCEDLYEFTFTKCEGDLEVDVADADSDEGDCEYIKEIKTTEISTKTIAGNEGSKGQVRGWLIFLLIALVVGAAISLYVRHQRKKQAAGKTSSTDDNPMAPEQGPSNEKLLDHAEDDPTAAEEEVIEWINSW